MEPKLKRVSGANPGRYQKTLALSGKFLALFRSIKISSQDKIVLCLLYYFFRARLFKPIAFRLLLKPKNKTFFFYLRIFGRNITKKKWL